MNDIIIWALIIFIFLIISGLYVSEYTHSDNKKYNYTSSNMQQLNTNEYFHNPTISPISQQKQGAEALYNWGVPSNKMRNENDHDYNPKIDYSCHNTCHKSCPVICPNKCKAKPVETVNKSSSNCDKPKEELPSCSKPKEESPSCSKPKEESKCGHNCNYSCPSPCPNKCNKPLHTYDSRFLNNDDSIYKEKIYLNTNCYTCDITTNKDMDKYVLKSSVPSCPDMSEFITKNMMNSNPDLSDYILKSEVKPCEKIDYTKYVLKKHIPACPVCPVCPKIKSLKEQNIKDHPEIGKYVSTSDLSKYYRIKDEYRNTSLDLNPYNGHVRMSVIPKGEDLNNQLKSLSEDEKQDLAKDVYSTLNTNYKKDLINKLFDKLNSNDRKELIDNLSGNLSEKERKDLNQKLFSNKISEKEKENIANRLNSIIEEEKMHERKHMQHLLEEDAYHKRLENKKCDERNEKKKKCEEKNEQKNEQINQQINQKKNQQTNQQINKCDEKKKSGFLDSIFDYKLTSNLLGNIKGYYTGDNVYQEY